MVDEKKERNEMKAQQKAERKAQKKAEREKLAKEKAERRAEQRAKHPPILFQPKPPLPIMKSEYPESIKCPHCRVDVTTRVTRRVGNGTLLISSGICGVGCVAFLIGWFVGAFVPFWCGSAKDAEHSCPSCNARVGIKKLID